MTYTAEEVRAHAQILMDWRDRSDPCVGNDDAADMLTAYATLLERQAAGVTDEAVERVLQAFYVGNVRKPWSWRETEDMDEPDAVFAPMRAALLAVWPVAAEPAAQPAERQGESAVEGQGINYKSMFESAVQALADIDELLGLPEDGCNDPQTTVSALADFIAGHNDMQRYRDEWVDAQYLAAGYPAAPVGVPDGWRWAQGLIEQLPATHDGRNSWLLNHGIGPEADWLRAEHKRYAEAWHNWRPGKPNPERRQYAAAPSAPQGVE